MARPILVFIDGIALWSPGVPDWASARRAFSEDAPDALPAAPPGTAAHRARPKPGLLSPNEQRRVPGTVALAMEVAGAAAQMSGHPGDGLASVFASAHGDLEINSNLCSALAGDPLQVSPFKFIHSVHNAASGYWSMSTSCQLPTTSLSAHVHSFANGLLEAAMQCVADERPVLLAAYDMETAGPLASATASRGTLGFALVLSPRATPRSTVLLEIAPESAASRDDGTAAEPSAPLRSAMAKTLARCGISDALPLIEALARLEAAGEEPGASGHGAGRASTALRLVLSPWLRLGVKLVGWDGCAPPPC